MVSRCGSQALRPADAFGCGRRLGRQYRARVGGHFGSTGRFCRLGVGGHFVGRFCRRTPSPSTRWTQTYACRSQIISGGFSMDTGGLLILRSDQPSRPNAITCCFFSSFKTLLTSTEGIRPRVKINVLNDGYRWPVLK